jgi:HAD superfamily hydrolase (TIGR01490 family)
VNSSPNRASVAAFFDLDGTLIPFPTLERRLFRALVYRRAIRETNVAFWAAEALRLAPCGLAFVRQANKMHLRGVSAGAASAMAERIASVSHLAFFPRAVDRAAWHVAQGHNVVLVSGTLQLLALCAALSLREALTRRGVTTSIVVRATQLEEMRGHWTGRVAGVPMFGPAKASAIDELAAHLGLDLGACFAYGDSVHDRQMLESVGHPVAVNASPELRRVAERCGWPMVEWSSAGTGRNQVEGAGARIAERKVETLG